MALQALAVTLAAQLATVPLVAWYYNLISPVSIVANMVVVPLTGLIMLLGVLAAFLGLIWLPLASLINVSTGLVLDIFLTLIFFCRRLPGAVVFLTTPPILLAAAWYAGLLALVEDYAGCCRETVGQYTKRWGWVAVGAALAVVLVLLWWPWSGRQELAVHFLDVGQGDSILIQTPGVKTCLLIPGAGWAN
ncbi:MAG: ComEC/Rec2 family competence protein [Candidatus Syntrophopropionicum ammoniitolerans]